MTLSDFCLDLLIPVNCMIQLNRSAINGAYNFLEGKKEEGWSNIRNFFVDQACRYQTSVKLWDAQRPGAPLHQNYPDFLSESDFKIPNKRTKVEAPASKGQAKNQLRKLVRSCQQTTKSMIHNNNRLVGGMSNNDLIKISKGTNRILNLCSNYIPDDAHNSDDVHQLIRYEIFRLVTHTSYYQLRPY